MFWKSTLMDIPSAAYLAKNPMDHCRRKGTSASRPFPARAAAN